ncbi:thioredoxin domain-containing protein, partial [Salmonella sp. s54412]|uniref:thioredoxin domain-containing protein n=1 Tax=Salmonella sp. s54412 TaxID=3160128 RepID=UPI003754795D
KDVESVVIAKMDATANDSPPQYEVQGFPTLYWSPKNGKDKPEKYEGGREVADFVEFIKKKASDPVNLSDEEEKTKKSQKDEEAL